MHEAHPLALEAKKVLPNGHSSDTLTIILDAHKLEGFSGTLLPPPPKALLTLGTPLPAPTYDLYR